MSGVRHDLRHELATLRTLLAVAGDDPSLDAAGIRRLLTVAQGEVGLAFDLLDALPIPSPRAPSRSETASPGPTDIGARSEVSGVLRAAATATAPKGRSIDVDAPAPLYVAMARTGLARVVRNLLGNALAATRSDGTVRLVARADAPPDQRRRRGADRAYVRLEFHDDGPGPGPGGFHRGGGLGLDVVRSLVLPAGGWLVLGTSPLGGACATVTLPAPAAVGA